MARAQQRVSRVTFSRYRVCICHSVMCICHSIVCICHSIVCICHSAMCIWYSIMCWLFSDVRLSFTLLCLPILHSIMACSHSIIQYRWGAPLNTTGWKDCAWCCREGALPHKMATAWPCAVKESVRSGRLEIIQKLNVGHLQYHEAD